MGLLSRLGSTIEEIYNKRSSFILCLHQIGKLNPTWNAIALILLEMHRRTCSRSGPCTGRRPGFAPSRSGHSWPASASCCSSSLQRSRSGARGGTSWSEAYAGNRSAKDSLWNVEVLSLNAMNIDSAIVQLFTRHRSILESKLDFFPTFLFATKATVIFAIWLMHSCIKQEQLHWPNCY